MNMITNKPPRLRTFVYDFRVGDEYGNGDIMILEPHHFKMSDEYILAQIMTDVTGTVYAVY